MRSCDTCKVVLDEGAAYCPRCGRPVPIEVVQDAAHVVRRLVTEANLSRIRGDFDAAISSCTEALRLQPADPEIHSVLGDIYESAGNLEEAARWFQMAIELTPDSALDAAKLERIRARIRKRSRRSRPETTTGNWTRTFLTKGRHADPTIRKIVLFLATSALILLGFGVLAWFYEHKTSQPDTKKSYKPPITRTTPPSMPPNTAIPPIGGNMDTVTRPSLELQLMSSLQTSPLVGDRHLVVEDVKLDPRTGGASITFRLPEPSIPLSKPDIIKNSASVAKAAFTAHNELTTISIRVLAGIPNKNGVVEPHLVLICDTYRQLNEIDPLNTPPEQLARYFTNVWWGPELPQ